MTQNSDTEDVLLAYKLGARETVVGRHVNKSLANVLEEMQRENRCKLRKKGFRKFANKLPQRHRFDCETCLAFKKTTKGAEGPVPIVSYRFTFVAAKEQDGIFVTAINLPHIHSMTPS